MLARALQQGLGLQMPWHAASPAAALRVPDLLAAGSCSMVPCRPTPHGSSGCSVLGNRHRRHVVQQQVQHLMQRAGSSTVWHRSGRQLQVLAGSAAAVRVTK